MNPVYAGTDPRTYAASIRACTSSIRARIISGSVIAKTGGRDYAARSAYGYQFTADTGIFVTVNTAGSTKAAGTLVATIEYTMEGSAS